MLTDAFTKWAQAVSCKDQSEVTVSRSSVTIYFPSTGSRCTCISIRIKVSWFINCVAYLAYTRVAVTMHRVMARLSVLTEH